MGNIPMPDRELAAKGAKETTRNTARDRKSKRPNTAGVAQPRAVPAWTLRVGYEGAAIPFISATVAEQLRSLLRPWWDVLDLVDSDTQDRRATNLVNIVPVERLKEVANMVRPDSFHHESKEQQGD